MKKKLVALVFLLSLIFLPLNAKAAIRPTNLDEALTEEAIEHDFTNYEETDDQITIYLFRGKGCGYCRNFLTFLNSIVPEYGEYFKVVSYEVWNNPDNSALFQTVGKYLNKEVRGVPFIIIGDKTYSGYSSTLDEELKAAIKAEYDKKDRTDVILAMEDDIESGEFDPNAKVEEETVKDFDISKYVTKNLDQALTEEGIEHDFSNYREADDQVTIYLFRGKGCGYCKRFLTYLNSLVPEYGKYFKVVSFEVWNDSTNSALLQSVGSFIGQDIGGVPFIIIGSKTFPGYTSDWDEDIKKAILDEYNAKEKTDIFKDMAANGAGFGGSGSGNGSGSGSGSGNGSAYSNTSIKDESKISIGTVIIVNVVLIVIVAGTTLSYISYTNNKVLVLSTKVELLQREVDMLKIAKEEPKVEEKKETEKNTKKTQK